MGWVLGLVVLAALVYIAWEFRWYLRTLRQAWNGEDAGEEVGARREPEPAGRPRAT